MRKAKHAFRLQVRLGEFIQFHKNQTIPDEYYAESSPYHGFIMDHSDGMILKPKTVVRLPSAVSQEVYVNPDLARIAKMPEHIEKNTEEREKSETVVEATSKLQQPPPKMQGVVTAPKTQNVKRVGKK